MIQNLLLSLLVALQPAPQAPDQPTPQNAAPPPLAAEGGGAAPLLAPLRTYAGPSQPLLVNVNTRGPVDLVLVDFIGNSTFGGRTRTPVQGTVNLREIFAEQIRDSGTFLVYATAPGGTPANFVGTPLVLHARADTRRGAPAGPMIYKVEPLRYAVLSTSAGELKVCFYYDAAPNTVSAIQRLIEGRFYDGLEFFRIEPGFVLQTGDPRNNGTGGPGFFLDAEFSDRQHLAGVLSIARVTDPNEAPGLLPRAEYANSGGSQFFICLNYDTAKQLDRRYTAFARIVDGLGVLRNLESTPLEQGRDGRPGRPKSPPSIQSVRLVEVTPGDNPYTTLKVVEGTGVTLPPRTPAAPTTPAAPAATPAATPSNGAPADPAPALPPTTVTPVP